MAVELEGVPVQPVRRAYGLIGESRDSAQLEVIGSDLADHDAAAGGPEVDRGNAVPL